MRNYLAQMVDLTGDGYLNPVPAIYDNGIHARKVSQITSISIHHDASPRPHDYDSIARYRQEAAEHYRRLGPGLQYHYKIDNVGQIFKIRPLKTWLYCVGGGENVTTLAICLDGYFHPPHNEYPTREQYEALGQLLINLCEEHPEFPATYPNVRPHRDFMATACPGDILAPWVFAIQRKLDVLNIPASAVYDWPEFQEPKAVLPPAPTPAPEPSPQPTPPVVPPAIPATPIQLPTTPGTSPLPKIDPLSGSVMPPPVSDKPSSLPGSINSSDNTINSPLRLPSRDSAVGRMIATARQILVWFGGFATVLMAVTQDPIYHAVLLNYAPWVVVFATLLGGLGSLVENLLRTEVKGY